MYNKLLSTTNDLQLHLSQWKYTQAKKVHITSKGTLSNFHAHLTDTLIRPKWITFMGHNVPQTIVFLSVKWALSAMAKDK